MKRLSFVSIGICSLLIPASLFSRTLTIRNPTRSTALIVYLIDNATNKKIPFTTQQLQNMYMWPKDGSVEPLNSICEGCGLIYSNNLHEFYGIVQGGPVIDPTNCPGGGAYEVVTCSPGSTLPAGTQIPGCWNFQMYPGVASITLDDSTSYRLMIEKRAVRWHDDLDKACGLWQKKWPSYELFAAVSNYSPYYIYAGTEDIDLTTADPQYIVPTPFPTP